MTEPPIVPLLILMSPLAQTFPVIDVDEPATSATDVSDAGFIKKTDPEILFPPDKAMPCSDTKSPANAILLELDIPE
jgi:hypothetical protein